MTTRNLPARAAFLLLAAGLLPAFTRLLPSTVSAFDEYIRSAEAAMEQSRAAGRLPDWDAKLRTGEIVTEGREMQAPHGQIQDWTGRMFIAGGTVAKVRAVLQDYANYKRTYSPEVMESGLIARNGDEFDVFLRLYKKQILTVVLNTEYRVRYGQVDARRMYVISHSTRIAEVKSPKRSYTEEAPVGDDNGFLWRINAYWRVEETGGGAYAELRAISLSRDVPLGLGWIAGSFVRKFPRESMLATLAATRKAALVR